MWPTPWQEEWKYYAKRKRKYLFPQRRSPVSSLMLLELVYEFIIGNVSCLLIKSFLL